MRPVERVQQQVDAYRRRGIDGFLACYAGDAVIRDGDGNTLMTGRDELQNQYGPFFTENPDLSVEILNRVKVGAWVVDCERIRYAAEDLRAIVGYRIQDDLITSVVIISDD